MKNTISPKGQIAFPTKFRKKDNIQPGQEFDVERLSRGDYRFVRRTTPNEGVVDWLLACPNKGYFVPIESERNSTE